MSAAPDSTTDILNQSGESITGIKQAAVSVVEDSKSETPTENDKTVKESVKNETQNGGDKTENVANETENSTANGGENGAIGDKTENVAEKIKNSTENGGEIEVISGEVENVKENARKDVDDQDGVPASSDKEGDKTPKDAEVVAICHGENGTEDALKSKEELLKQAEKAFLEGKRELKIQDFGAAVTSLGTACELFTEIYGELADELGDVYFHYGKALFGNARNQSEVLGDQIDKDKNEESEDDDEEDQAENDVEQKTDADTAEEVSENAEAPEPSGSAADVKADTTQGEDEDGEGDDLQLSWQILEMAKVVYQKKAEDNPEVALKLSEVYLTLGENGLESERYDTAIADMHTCLEMQEKNLKPDDRLIAETLYQLGMAYSLSENFDEGVSHYEKSISQLERRLASLEQAQKDGKKVVDGEQRDSFYTIENEVKDIHEVVKEIRDKIADTRESKRVMKEQLAEKLGFSAFGTPNGDGPSSSKPISNISHLIKKRKNDDEPDQGGEKKPKID